MRQMRWVGLIVVAAGLLLPAWSQAAIVGYWTFDADDINDSSGNNYHGTLNGGGYSSDTPGALAGGRSLDLTGGDNYAVIDSAGAEAPFNLDTLTVSCWVKGWPDGGWEPFVSKRGESGQGWQLRRHGGGNRQTFTLRGHGNDDPEGIVDLNNANWKHVVGTYDGATRRLYVNGIRTRTDAETGAINDTPRRVVLGARENNDGTGFESYSRISLDDVAIFDDGLASNQVAYVAGGGSAATLPAAAAMPPPAGWSADDIGGPMAGDTEYHPGSGTFSITGSGGDIWGSSDSFHLAHQDRSGDFVSTVRLVSQQNSDGWAKAGIMARDGTDANAIHVDTSATPSNGIGQQWRDDTGGGSGSTNFSGDPNSGSAPFWLRLKRRGSEFSSAWAPDVGGVAGVWSAELTHTSNNMPADVRLGLNVTSHNGGRYSTAVFDNVTVGNWESQATVQLKGASVYGSAYVNNLDDPGTHLPATWKLERNLAFQALRAPDGSPGLQADWFISNHPFTDPPDFTQVVTRIQRNNGDYPGTPWDGGGDMNNFRVSYHGEIYAPVDGTYTFEEKVDDEMWLSIDGTEIRHDGDWGNTSQASIALTAGWHDIEFRTREGGGGDDARLSWDMGIGEWVVLEADAQMAQLLAQGTDSAGGPGAEALLYNFPMDQIGQMAQLQLSAGYVGTEVVAETEGLIIPEPASMALLALGVMGLGGYVRRRRAA